MKCYDQAARRKFDYLHGRQRRVVRQAAGVPQGGDGDEPVDCRIDDVDALAGVVRFAARNTSRAPAWHRDRMACGPPRRWGNSNW